MNASSTSSRLPTMTFSTFPITNSATSRTLCIELRTSRIWYASNSMATTTSLSPVASLIFLPAAAGAGVIAPDLLTDAGGFLGPFDRLPICLERRSDRLWRLALNRDVVDRVTDVVTNRREEPLKNVERFGAVFDQRIALAVSPQANSLAQVVDRGQMVDPESIDDLEH